MQMLYNLYFNNGQRPEKVTAADVADWCYSDVEEADVTALSPRETYVNIHGDKWERIR